MPLIPTYESSAVPARRTPFLVTPRTEVGAAITGLGRVVTDIAIKFKRAEEVTQYNESMRGLREDLTEFRFSFAERADFENFQEDFQKGSAAIGKKHFEEMKDNSLWDSFEAQMDGAIISTEVAVRTMRRQKQVDFGRASYFTTMERIAEEYGKSTEVEKESLMVQMGDITELNVDVGYISQQEAQKSMKEFAYNAMKSDVWHTARALGSEAGIGWLQREKNTPGLTRADRNSLIAELRKEWNAEIRAQERAEKIVEENRKREVEESNFAAWQGFHTGELTMSDLNGLATMRKISLQTYNAIIGKYKGEESENDPVVVGEIAENLELGMDIEPALEDALEHGRIKTETYVSLKRAMAVKDYKRGLYYINNSLKPTQYEAWSPDKFRRHADAVDEYNERVADGGEPVEESRQIVDLYLSEMRRTLTGLRRPKLLIGPKTDLQALRDAEERTVMAFDTGAISPTEFERETELLRSLIELASDILDKTSEIDVKKLEKRLKKQEK